MYSRAAIFFVLDMWISMQGAQLYLQTKLKVWEKPMQESFTAQLQTLRHISYPVVLNVLLSVHLAKQSPVTDAVKFA
jgi:hypothetical protein